MNQCEKCGAKTDPSSFELFDYCAECNRTLCPACMKKGCCNIIPATSGMEEDGESAAEVDERIIKRIQKKKDGAA